MTSQTVTQQTVGAALLPQVNLLPPEIQEARKFKRLQVAMGGAVVAAAGVIGVLYLSAHGNVADAQKRVDAAAARQTDLQRQLGSLKDVTSVYASVAAHEQMLKTAMASEVLWSHYLNDLTLRIPDNVWLTNMTVTQSDAAAAKTAAASVTPTGLGTLQFTGVAFAHDDVASWLESLAKEKGYTNPYFSSSTVAEIGKRKVVNFSSTVTVTPDALSGRYTKPAGN